MVGKGLAENPNTRKHELGCSRGGRARRVGSDDIQRATRKPEGVRIARMPRPDSAPARRTPPTVGTSKHIALSLSNPERWDPPDSRSHTRYAPAGKRRRTSSLRLR